STGLALMVGVVRVLIVGRSGTRLVLTENVVGVLIASKTGDGSGGITSGDGSGGITNGSGSGSRSGGITTTEMLENSDVSFGSVAVASMYGPMGPVRTNVAVKVARLSLPVVTVCEPSSVCP